MEARPLEEEFHDYTSATPWERLAADVERVLRGWMSSATGAGAGLEEQEAVLEHRLPFRRESYRLYLQCTGDDMAASSATNFMAASSPAAAGCPPAWLCGHHSLQRWFAVGTYILLAPDSFSQRVQDDQEASTLLSALSIALRSCAAPWPAFVPLHNVYRQRCLGVQVGLGTDGRLFQRFFESDSTQSSQFPSGLLYLHNQLALFSKALGSHCPDAANAAEVQLGGGAGTGWYFTLAARQRLGVPSISTGYCQTPGSVAEEDGALAAVDDWDEGAPWRAWATPADPVGGIELELVWPELPLLDERNALSSEPPHRASATLWLLSAYAPTTGKSALPAELLCVAAVDLSPQKGGLVEMLACLADASLAGSSAGSVHDLVEEFWYRARRPLPRLPPEPVLQGVLRDVFDIHGEDLPIVELPFGAGRAPATHAADTPSLLRLLKAAPQGALLLRLALHSLTFGNARAVAQLWLRFVRELRFRYWEPGRPLPRLDAVQQPDLGACLLHQKLQMLDICIRALQKGGAAAAGLEDTEQQRGEDGPPGEGRRSSSADSFVSCDADSDAVMADGESGGADGVSTDGIRLQLAEAKGVVGQLAGARLLEAEHRPVNIPRLQRPAILTEDLMTEREEVLHSLGSNQLDSVHVRLQGDQLLSDMSAFKAANPGCVFEDFIRWYSPADWAPGEQQPRGRLSKRMAVPGNTWLACWELAQARTASEQKPLFEPGQEGERALHFLETLQPEKLFQELHALGIAAAVGLLSESAGAALPSAKRTIREVVQQVAGVLQQQVGSDGERGYVLQRLSYLERVLLVAESLLRRLGNQPEVVRLADDLLQAALAGGKEGPGRGHQQHCLRKATVETSAEREYISMLLSLDASEGGAPPDTHRGLEWLIQCRPSSQQGDSSGCSPGWSSHMLTTIAPDGVHIATAITAPQD